MSPGSFLSPFLFFPQLAWLRRGHDGHRGLQKQSTGHSRWPNLASADSVGGEAGLRESVRTATHPKVFTARPRVACRVRPVQAARTCCSSRRDGSGNGRGGCMRPAGGMVTRGCPRGAHARPGPPYAPQTRGRPPAARLGVGAPRPYKARSTRRPCALVVPVRELLPATGVRPRRTEAVAGHVPRAARGRQLGQAASRGCVSHGARLGWRLPRRAARTTHEHRRECGAKARADRRGSEPVHEYGCVHHGRLRRGHWATRACPGRDLRPPRACPGHEPGP
jgi:hypothetical protein